jgi:hypothetical protein
MPTSAIIPLHLILCTNIFNGYSESPIYMKLGLYSNEYIQDIVFMRDSLKKFSLEAFCSRRDNAGALNNPFSDGGPPGITMR